MDLFSSDRTGLFFLMRITLRRNLVFKVAHQQGYSIHCTYIHNYIQVLTFYSMVGAPGRVGALHRAENYGAPFPTTECICVQYSIRDQRIRQSGLVALSQVSRQLISSWSISKTESVSYYLDCS